MRFFRLTFTTILVALLLAACASGEKVTAQQIMDGLKQTRENTHDAHAKVVVSTTGTGDKDGNFTIELWLNKATATNAAGKALTQSHIKVLEASQPDLVGSELVNDGSTVWLYNPKQNKVITGKLSELQQGSVGAQDPTAQMMRMQSQLQQILDDSNVNIVANNDPVAGLDAWQVKLTPTTEAKDQLQIGSIVDTQLWVSHDRYIPLKVIVDAGDLGKIQAAVQEIQLDKGVSAAQFTFTPPAGAQVENAADLVKQAKPQTTTLDKARAATSFPLLVPATLPNGVSLQQVQTVSLGGESVIQNYDGAIDFSLVQTKGNGAFGQNDLPRGAKTQTVTVRGQEGTLVKGSGNEQGTLLRWQEHGVTIIIAGTLTAEQAQTIATSLK